MAEKVSNIEDLKTRMGSVFKADKASGVDSVYQFDLSGDNGGQFWLKVKDGAYEAGDGSSDNPTITLTASADDFFKVVNGDMAAMSAFMGGKIKIKGDMSQALKLQSIFAFG
jgi:putative sterol carrier protein